MQIAPGGLHQPRQTDVFLLPPSFFVVYKYKPDCKSTHSPSWLRFWAFALAGPSFSAHTSYPLVTWLTHTYHFKDFIYRNVQQIPELPGVGILLCFHSPAGKSLCTFSKKYLLVYIYQLNLKISKSGKKCLTQLIRCFIKVEVNF